MSADRIVFLDFDGVLNHTATLHRVGHDCEDIDRGMLGVDPVCVQALDSIITRTDARIVISSTWRTMFPVGQLARLLRRQGLTRWTNIIGKTPDNGLARGLQIQQWMESHSSPVGSFVILDDEDDMAHLLHRLVRCDFRGGGLNQDLADRAVEMLTGGPHV